MHHPLQPLWHLAAAPMLSHALQQAIELRLFAHLQPPQSATAVARTLALQPDSTAVWLDTLWSMGLLHRANGKEAVLYSLSTLAAQFFHPDSAWDCASAWQARAQFLAAFATQWPTLLQQGISAPDKPQPEHWAQAARAHLGQEQRNISAAQLPALLARLPPLPARGRFADIGGGPGHVAVALARHLPQWQGVVVEQSDTAAVAQETIDAASLSARLSALTCDVNQDDIGSGYDLIWCSSVLHFVHHPQAVVAKMHMALRPGGRLLLAHAELSNDPQQAAQVLPFYAGVVLRGGQLPRQGDIAHWMQAAGFTDIRALGRMAWALAPLWVYTGQRT